MRIKVYAEYSELYEMPVVTDIKGIKSCQENIMNEVERGLYRVGDYLAIDWAKVDLPGSLRQYVTVVQSLNSSTQGV